MKTIISTIATSVMLALIVFGMFVPDDLQNLQEDSVLSTNNFNELLSLKEFDSVSKDNKANNVMDYTNMPVKCSDSQILVKLNYKLDISYNTHSFNYKCTYSPFFFDNAIEHKTTPWNDTQYKNNQSFHFLDRHQVKCSQGYGLNSFEIKQNNEDKSKIRIEYSCAKLPPMYNDLKTKNTSKVTGSGFFGGNSWSNIKDFGDDYSLVLINGFKLEANYDGGFKFWFKLWYYEK